VECKTDLVVTTCQPRSKESIRAFEKVDLM
jgi:hypothetical protein